MYTLKIELSNDDLQNLDFILPEIAKHLEYGFKRGIEFPVNWSIRKED